MITPVNSINTRIQTENRLNGASSANPSFKCKVKLPSGEYPINEIRKAKYIIKEGNPEWKKALFKDVYRQNKDSHYAILTSQKTKVGRTLDRINIDCLTLGLGEIYFLARAAKDASKARDYVTYMSKIVNDLKTNRIKETSAKLEKDKLANQRRLEYTSKIEDAHEKVIKPEVLDVIQRQREGKPTSMPKNIMFVHKDSKANKNLMDWTKEEANANVITCDARQWVQEDSQQGLDDLLTSCRNRFYSTGDWNLIHAENMEELINPEISDESVIHTMRDYMSAMPDYKSTFMFSTKDPSKLDYEALQAHRISKTMDFSDIVTPKTAALEDAKARLNDKTAQKEAPLSTINDLLYVITENPKNEIRWEDSMSSNLSEEVRSFVKDKLFIEKDPKAGQKITTAEEYEKIFDKLITKEEYQETIGKIEDPSEYKKAVIDLYNSRNFDEQSDSVKYMRVFNEAVKNVR